ncbi:sodium-independent anion transporter [Clostridium tetani]|uniref:SulP family inorganic anion transporter n=1 Tax=Clostridium tetani TaxID=1513 RepID=UPI000513BEEE|nr:SulP family inorganic anion transporter [Clostridium tetani]KGI39983.1 sulfate permease [Clostridium tetani ATCC 9441]RXI75734.1 STAS domain-containing protein [Clostridium tetani]RXM58802.1 STAS domain-containing protein [Clostridium tetani]WFN60779.1 SulP family inorganic anion transporter [Clostridium tetani]SUY55722.1 low affinity sulphate transporter 3 [Clostridium tetani]
MLKPEFLSILKNEKGNLTKEGLIKDFIAGIIVAIIALPLSVALGIASGVSPEKGLITAIIAGFFISFLGGSRVQIGGPTGAFVVIIYGIIEKYGIDGLIVATLMAGIMLVIFGLLKFGSLIKYISYPITVGFTAGIAVTLFSTQVKDFLGLSINKVPSEFLPKWSMYISNMGTINWVTLALGIFSLAVIIVWPKFNEKIPGALVALILSTFIAYFFKLDVATIGTQFGEISSKIPVPKLPIVDIITLQKLIKPAFTIAILAAIESLLSAVVADGMIGEKHDSNMELVAQGVGNITSALFGGIPATGAIARTAANVKSGGRTPIAGMVHAITLLLIMKVLMPLAKYIPLTTLAAVLIVVSYNMSGWRTFRDMLRAPKSDVLILLATFFITVIFDLVIAIEVGIIISMCLFMRRMALAIEVNELDGSYCSKKLRLEGIHTNKIGDEILIYDIKGPLFFAGIDSFISSIESLNTESKVVILRMKNMPVLDVTAYGELKKIEKLCMDEEIKLIMSEVQKQPMKVMKNMGMVSRLGERRFIKTLEEAIRTANNCCID